MRQAKDPTALHFVIANRMRELLDYRQVSLFLQRPNGRLVVEAVSDVPVLGQNTPSNPSLWMRRIGNRGRSGVRPM